MNQGLPTPDHPIMMVSRRDFRLSSLSGYVVNFKADVPVRVPPFVYQEAIEIGATEAEEQPEELAETTEEETTHESVAEAARLEAEAKIAYVEKAIVKLMEKADNGPDFNATGYPKHTSVIAVLSPQCPRPTATEIQEIFDDMREDVQYAEFFGD